MLRSCSCGWFTRNDVSRFKLAQYQLVRALLRREGSCALVSCLPQPPRIHRRERNEADAAERHVAADQGAGGPAEQFRQDARVRESGALVLAEGDEVVVGTGAPPEREGVGERHRADGEEAPAEPSAPDGALPRS